MCFRVTDRTLSETSELIPRPLPDPVIGRTVLAGGYTDLAHVYVLSEELLHSYVRPLAGRWDLDDIGGAV